MSKVHRCGARVIGLADEPNFHACLSNDGLDDTEWLAERAQNRPLLDMELQVSQNITPYCGIGDFRRIQSKIFNGHSKRNSVRFPDLQKFRIEPADQSAAADK